MISVLRNIYTVLGLRKLILLLSPGILLQGCFTGVEGTKTITMSSKEVMASNIPSPEEQLMSHIAGDDLSEWQPGRKFAIADDKASLIFQRISEDKATAALKTGKEITFEGISEIPSISGGKNVGIVFVCDGERLIYNTGMSPQTAASGIKSDAIPLITDMEMVQEADSLLRGRKLWTRSRLWYDHNGERIQGVKFAPVTVTDVTQGDATFPLRINFTDEDGTDAYMLVGATGAGVSSHRFDILFSLSDPRENHRRISEDNWRAIKNGTVNIGMTKEECRLSLGNPEESTGGHDYSYTSDLWKYSDGKWLMFRDGLLVEYRE